MIERVAYLSMHTSPLVQPGSGDAGGMNVYIDELASTMADRGVGVTVFTRRFDPDQPPVVSLQPGVEVVHVEAGPVAELPAAHQAKYVQEFAAGVVTELVRSEARYDVVHSHYWLSGWAGILVKRALGLPLANSFHTLGRVKDATRRRDQPPESLLRVAAEHEVIAGSDCVVASTPGEARDLLERYGADPGRLCMSPPGVNHEIFSPGPSGAARSELGLGVGPLVLFVGRIQALKGADVAVEAFAQISRRVPSARMVVVGGPSGPDGPGEAAAVRQRAARLGLADRVCFLAPRPHAELSTLYRAADVVLFPSRSESFGLVAAEAQSCGIPVVAARVGGLAYAVDDEESGFLVDGWEPSDYVEPVVRILQDPELATRLGKGAVEFAGRFSWEATADRLLELYDGITGRN